jgi:hypothetical protein
LVAILVGCWGAQSAASWAVQTAGDSADTKAERLVVMKAATRAGLSAVQQVAC